MGGEGTITHMIQSLRSNRNLLKNKTRFFKRRNNEDILGVKKSLVFRTISPVKSRLYRQKLKSEHHRRIILQAVVVVLVILVLLYLVLQLFNKTI